MIGCSAVCFANNVKKTKPNQIEKNTQPIHLLSNYRLYSSPPSVAGSIKISVRVDRG